MPSPRRSHVDVVDRPFFAPGRQSGGGVGVISR
jgi:hypothetical protein